MWGVGVEWWEETWAGQPWRRSVWFHHILFLFLHLLPTRNLSSSAFMAFLLFFFFFRLSLTSFCYQSASSRSGVTSIKWLQKVVTSSLWDTPCQLVTGNCLIRDRNRRQETEPKEWGRGWVHSEGRALFTLTFVEYRLTLWRAPLLLWNPPRHDCFCNSPAWFSICVSSKHSWDVLITTQALISLTGSLVYILLFLKVFIRAR